ncbi:hypothetical protein OAA60_01300 [Porticoccaceae bacterium]|nr:hypothetical protein [Porticoccaceae bacterium]
MSKITLVTGLWDIGRGNLQEGWSRSFPHYLEKFKQLLEVESNMIIFGDEELENFVFNIRNQDNTQFIRRDLSWFERSGFFFRIQDIRKKSEWLNQSGWLSNSTQATLEYYNPLVMSKVFLLNDANLLDKFDSEYMFWIDAGLTNTVHPGYFTKDKVLDRLPKLIDNFHFISFPYDGKVEIHGFEYKSMCDFAGKEVDMVCRGGFFGGTKESISEINGLYYSIIDDTLREGLMGTEESLFTIMTYRHPELITYSEIESNGLVGKFFEDLKNDEVTIKTKMDVVNTIESIDIGKVGLYVIGFNSPKQFKTLIKSMIQYDNDFISKPKKYLLDNSTDLSTTPDYIKLCDEYGFEHIKKENLGICGGRQWIAEHFDGGDLELMYFFEDDMFFYPNKGEVCKNGFNRDTPKLYSKTLSIVKKEGFDFLKLNYTEFFGDNGTQWSWYNVPQNFRESHWPNKRKLPERGLDPNSPRTNFNNIKTYSGLSYVDGEIYYCNWPQLVTKKGNKKMFLTEKWGNPYEQTWMSYIYQETVKNNIKPGLLLLTPTEHNRFEHYDKNLRKES